MKNKDEIDLFRAFEGLQEEISLLIKEMNALVEENKQLIIRNEDLQDEVDSLWAMMDEITKSDIENFSHILDEIKTDVITRALMVSKKKVDC
jgi:regulator of replication initiation timing